MFGLALLEVPNLPVYVGPLNLTSPLVTLVIGAAALWQLSGYFVLLKRYDADRAADKEERERWERIRLERLERLEKDILLRLSDMQATVKDGHTRQEKYYATVDQLNGFGGRLERLQTELREAAAEARAAHNVGMQASNDVKLLAQRIEAGIEKGMQRLEAQFERMQTGGKG